MGFNLQELIASLVGGFSYNSADFSKRMERRSDYKSGIKNRYVNLPKITYHSGPYIMHLMHECGTKIADYSFTESFVIIT